MNRNEVIYRMCNERTKVGTKTIKPLECLRKEGTHYLPSPGWKVGAWKNMANSMNVHLPREKVLTGENTTRVGILDGGLVVHCRRFCTGVRVSHMTVNGLLHARKEE